MLGRSAEDYRVGWVCALPKELTAARAMLDEEHVDCYSGPSQDTNSYVLGRVHEHNVVLACLPVGTYGTTSAATVANNMLRTFTSIRFGLMVGIGGGIPNLDRGWDIRLGDVVVSQPDGTHGGVVQHDLRKNLGQDRSELKGSLKSPPTHLLTALANLQSRHSMYGHQISETISNTLQRLPQLAKSGYIHPGELKDSLHCNHVVYHPNMVSCSHCNRGVIFRESRQDASPHIHYGTIVSGNELMKNAVERDRLSQKFGAKCIEMEAAGLMNDFPCLVIRGICDYADAHKNDEWQEYAAFTAAAYARELLCAAKLTETSSARQPTESKDYSLGLNFFDAPDMGRDLFVGRELEIEEMERILRPHSENQPARELLIVGGMGGIGKTQLAINYAKKNRSSYSSIFWLNASSKSAVIASMRVLACRITSIEKISQLDDDQVQAHISNWLSERGNTRWLLIFDNHDDPSQYELKAYFPAASQGSIIVTTRQPRRLNGYQLKVGSMAKLEEGIQILATRSQRDSVVSDPNAHKLAVRLDGHPLALATAGAFLKESSVSFAEYLQQYSLKWCGLRTDEELPEYPSRTLFTTWNLSLDHIRQENVNAACILKFFAYLDNRDIWYDLLCGLGQNDDIPSWFSDTVRDRFSFENVMRVLNRYCLVEANHERGSYSLHVCVHDWILNELNHEFDINLYRLAVRSLSHHVSASDQRTLSLATYNRYVPHAIRLGHRSLMAVIRQQSLPKYFTKALLYSIACFLYYNAQYTTAELICETLLINEERSVCPDPRLILDLVSGLGLMYYHQSKLDKAEQMYQRALFGYENMFGPGHQSNLEAVCNLAALYLEQGKLAEAEQMYRRALVGLEQEFGPDHSKTLDIINDLGLVYHDQDKDDEAEQMYQRALAGYQHAFLSLTIPALSCVFNLGRLYKKQSRLDEAEKAFEQVAAAREKIFGPEHPSTINAFNGLEHTRWMKSKRTEEQARIGG